MKFKLFVLFIILALSITCRKSKLPPDWQKIKANAKFFVADTHFYYSAPEILSINVGGWEDGLYVTRDGLHLFCTYMPGDALSWILNWKPCKDFRPYYRGPLLGIDTIENIFGCKNYIHSDIVKTERSYTGYNFLPWHSSNLRKSMTYEGGACGVLKNSDSFDIFVFTIDEDENSQDIAILQNVPTNPNITGARHILSTPEKEDNPHIEKLSNGDLLLIFDRSRYVYYTLSKNNGQTWQVPQKITKVINDHAPYDIQPHLWYDGKDWWMYFCADSPNGMRSIYRSKQLIANDWDSWGPKQLVLEPKGIEGEYGDFIAVGEPTLTQWGDLYFVVIYGNTKTGNNYDVYDCDPWVLKRKK